MSGTRMGVVGCGGRMGRMLLAEIAASEGCALAGGCAKPGSGYVNQDIGELAGIGRLGISVGDDAEKLIRDSDVVIEFTTPAATATHVAQAAELGKPIVIGTTGLSAEEGAGVRQAARKVPIVWAPNMSLGINLLLGVVEEVARRLSPDWDVEIMEMHHRGKVDAPSGTALALGRAVAAGRKVTFEEVQQRGRDGITGPRRTGDIGFVALRGGDAVDLREGCDRGGALGPRPAARALRLEGGARSLMRRCACRIERIAPASERLAYRCRKLTPGVGRQNVTDHQAAAM
jgi:4-hydroxy-tetrahydrodipicolinate reductase